MHHIAGAVEVVSADWARPPRKRAVYTGLQGGRWTLARAEPPRGGWGLEGLLDLARGLRDRNRRPVLIGIDAVLGLPTAFARAAGLGGFPEGLSWLEASGGLAQESASPVAWKPEQPFFRVPRGRGGLLRFVEAAGGRSAVLREIEVRTRGKPVFALSGIPGTVGSGSRALWAELAQQLRRRDRDFRIWPFEGSLAELASGPSLTLAETYPRAAYAAALEESLPAPPLSIAKTRRASREAALARLESAPWVTESGVELRDLEAAAANEDDFDALLTAAALVRLIAQGQPLSCGLVDPALEGGILPTGALDLPAPRTRSSPGRTPAAGA